MCQECCKEIDLSKAKVGDRVRSVLSGWGKVTEVHTQDYEFSKYIKVQFECNDFHLGSYYLNGKRVMCDLCPEIVEWIPAKRKVRKEVTVFVNVYADGGKYPYCAEEDAKKYVAQTAIAIAVPCTGTYEVEE